MPLKNIFVALITLFISTTDAKPLDGYRITEILVLKNKHTLLLLSGPIVIRKYNISLGANPVGHKVREGDERTPEGHYKIVVGAPGYVDQVFEYDLKLSGLKTLNVELVKI